jgi:hypothetical protein
MRWLLVLALAGCGTSTQNTPDPPLGDAPDHAFRTCRGRTPDPAPLQDWRHRRTRILTLPAGAPNHSSQDSIARPGEPVRIPGKFAYGAISRDLQDENVRVVIDLCDQWRELGAYTTDGDGRISVPLPVALGPGVYELHFQVLGDGSTTASTLWILPAGTRLTLTDIDGTMTRSDRELFEQIRDGSHVPVPYPGALGLTDTHAAKRWIVVYLTGRPYYLTAQTRTWLADLAFVPGPLHVTDGNGDAVPSQGGVGDFKKAWIEGLLAQDYVIDFAYGNASTDIYAYLGAGIPASNVWIIGKHAGESGTNPAVDTWEPRVAEVMELDEIAQPFAW